MAVERNSAASQPRKTGVGPLKEERAAVLAAHLEAGLTLEAAAKEMGIARSYACQLRQIAGLGPLGGDRAFAILAARRKRVQDLVAAGKRPFEIAQALGAEIHAVRHDIAHLRSLGRLPSIPDKRPSIQGAELEGVLKALLEGESKRSIAKRLGRSATSILRAHRELAALGRIAPPPRSAVRNHDIDLHELADLRRAGLTCKQLAAHFGCSSTTAFMRIVVAEEKKIL